MGSCVPPKTCEGNLPSYVKFLGSSTFVALASTISQPNPAWIGGGSSPTLRFNELEELATEYWKSPVPQNNWIASSEEDTRMLMLERLLSQQLSVNKNSASNELEVKWKGAVFFTEPIPDPTTRTRYS